jgi:hypothetical protein
MNTLTQSTHKHIAVEQLKAGMHVMITDMDEM